jgi:hypothetical protein
VEIRRKPMIPHVVDPRKMLSNVTVTGYVKGMPAFRRMEPGPYQIQVVDSKKQNRKYKGYRGIRRE